MESWLGYQAAPTPRELWVELTSKCPADCIFCSRKLRRGAGEHLPFALFEGLLSQLRDPRRLVLNYSGESTVYPELIPAIRRARETGAFVELVSVLTTAPESLLAPLCESGLNRLTVSLHSASPERYAAIYRYGSWDLFRARLERLLALCRDAPHPPAVDFAFVAMDSNLAELRGVAAFADAAGVRHISIFPILRRDEIPVQFPAELNAGGGHRPAFVARLRETVEQAAARHPDIRFDITSELSPATAALGEVPVACGGMLPPGAQIHSCEQNPWETAHVLSNGDVVACEVLDKHPLGNLFEQPLTEIWNGEPYREFRRRYRHGEVPECRSCPWKKAFRPAAPAHEILAARGTSAQLLYGWHSPAADEPHIWSSQQAMAMLAPRPRSRTLHVCGMLPPGPEESPNQLTIYLNGDVVGTVENPWQEVIPFGLDFAVPAADTTTWTVEFRTTHVFRACERRAGADQRDLGFALVLMASKEFVDPVRSRRMRSEMGELGASIRAFDRWSLRCGRYFRFARGAGVKIFRPGLSVIIPERDNLTDLTDCLAALRTAAERWSEPIEVIVVVNGTPPGAYRTLRDEHPRAGWRFFRQPLGFSAAIRAGLELARYDWVYLMNNDVVLDPDALRAIARHRAPDVFSVSSQIFLRDTTRFREETNWAALLVESGLATIHDWIPRSSEPAPTFYSGGGASLFQRRLLRRLMDAAAYAPFYWEDVEWGWRARKLGYRSVFCPGSVAHHRQRATIDRYYPAAEVERILRRNRLVFQLRNFTTAGSLDRALEEIARSEEPVADWFLHPRTRRAIARGRFWNHRAPASDEEVFQTWSNSISSC